MKKYLTEIVIEKILSYFEKNKAQARFLIAILGFGFIILTLALSCGVTIFFYVLASRILL